MLQYLARKYKTIMDNKSLSKLILTVLVLLCGNQINVKCQVTEYVYAECTKPFKTTFKGSSAKLCRWMCGGKEYLDVNPFPIKNSSNSNLSCLNYTMPSETGMLSEFFQCNRSLGIWVPTQEISKSLNFSYIHVYYNNGSQPKYNYLNVTDQNKSSYFLCGLDNPAGAIGQNRVDCNDMNESTLYKTIQINQTNTTVQTNSHVSNTTALYNITSTEKLQDNSDIVNTTTTKKQFLAINSDPTTHTMSNTILIDSANNSAFTISTNQNLAITSNNISNVMQSNSTLLISTPNRTTTSNTGISNNFSTLSIDPVPPAGIEQNLTEWNNFTNMNHNLTTISNNISGITIRIITNTTTSRALTLPKTDIDSTIQTNNQIIVEWSNWYTVKCDLQKSRKKLTDSSIIQVVNVTFENVNLCDSIDPVYINERIKHINEIVKEEILKIRNRTTNKLNNISRHYSINKNVSITFSVFAIIFLIIVYSFVLLLDLPKLLNYLSSLKKKLRGRRNPIVKPFNISNCENNRQKELVLMKVRKCDQQIHSGIRSYKKKKSTRH